VALDTQKDPRPDGIYPRILKKIELVVKKPPAVLFVVAFWGFSMRVEGVVRCPFFTSGDRGNRGISILLAIPKLFEKLVCDVISPIILPSISVEQHGFVGGRSTVTSLVEFSNFALSEMEDRLQVDTVYIDFLIGWTMGCCWARKFRRLMTLVYWSIAGGFLLITLSRLCQLEFWDL
jgi:hypothetical protein